MTLPAEGGAPREVLPCAVDFAVSARGLFYVACGAGVERDVHVIERATGHDEVLGRTRLVAGIPPTPVVSPDGRTILVARGTHTADLMLIENFR